jgi:hypothetical protein
MTRAVRSAYRVFISQKHQPRLSGVLLTDAEIDAAFEFFDVKGARELNAQDLRDRLGMFVPGLTMRECKLLVSSDGAFTKDKLRELLIDNELTEFDPIREAFKVCVFLFRS